jgi:hypothetical protein
MAPRRFGFVSIDGDVVNSPMGGRRAMPRAHAALLAACDGARSAAEIAAAMLDGHPDAFDSVDSVLTVLADLHDEKLVAWGIELPLRWRPDERLRHELSRVGDEKVRADALRKVDELEASRRAVAEAAGDPDALDAALEALEQKFTTLTGLPPTTRSGAMYAARGLVFEDCLRDARVEIGTEVIGRIAPALGLLLTSARWMTYEIATRYREAFRAVYEDLAGRAGTRTVSFADAWFRFQRPLFGAKDRPIDGVVALLQKKWAEILALPAGMRHVELTANDLRAAVADAFAAPGPGWREARHQAPDIMLDASSPESVRAGEWTAVMGEMHIAFNSLDQALFIAQHPAPDELLRGMERDIPEPRILLVPSKEWPKLTLRTSRSLVSPKDFFFETGFDGAGEPSDRVLRLADLVLLEDGDGELVVRAGDGRVDVEIVDFLGDILSLVALSTFKLLPPAPRSPRVTIDRLVVSRETWRFAPAELGFAGAKTELDTFLGARRWARSNALPRFVYVKVTNEVKPVYIDLESPTFLSILARLARSAEEEIVVTEMLPSLDRIWLPGPSGERYTCELRVIARDLAGEANA